MTIYSGFSHVSLPEGTQRRNAAFWFESPDALTSSTTSTAMTPTKLDQPMPTSIKGQAWLQQWSNRWKERFPGEFLNHFCSATKKNEAGAQPDLMGFTNKHLIMKAFQRLQVLNRWVEYQEASMYVCMHASI